MTDWFQNHRVEWIADMVRVYGYVNRVHVCRKFGVSTPQASTDLARAMETYPDLMAYNTRSKRYEAL